MVRRRRKRVPYSKKDAVWLTKPDKQTKITAFYTDEEGRVRPITVKTNQVQELKERKEELKEKMKVGGRQLLGYADGRVPLYLRFEVHYEEPTDLEVMRRMPIDESASSWAFGTKEEVMRRMKNPEHWKYPTKAVRVRGLDVAETIARKLASYMGGAEIVDLRDGTYVVKSRGYYHYVG